MTVKAIPLPEGSLMQPYGQIAGGYTDAFQAEVVGEVTLEELIAVFFQTPLFRLERLILALVLRQPTWRRDVEALATGRADHFALWKVEARRPEEVMLAVGSGPIRSWLMVRPSTEARTQVIFGSAILPTRELDNPEVAALPRGYRMFDRLHQLYARLLLAAAARRLKRHRR